MTLPPGAMPLILAGVGVAAIALAAAWWVIRRRAATGTQARLRQACDDLLSGLLLPNAESGQIHIEHVVLTKKGIVVVDVRDVVGHVFGSETMQDWTVLGSNKRFTFPNPLPLLYDRIAAIRRLLPDTPVRGCVAFTGRAQFSKGFPPNVAMLDALIGELTAERNSTDGPAKELLREAWGRCAGVSGGSD